MEQKDWKKLSRIFDMVLTLPADGRTAYLENLCGGDAGLQKRVEQMLKDMEASDEFFEGKIEKNQELIQELDSLLINTEKEDDFFEGKTIGRWNLMKLIGRGGMGSVYKALRTDESGIQQTGALKIIHKSLITPSHIERFKLEQQILSGLQHPNIAGFIDSGITDDGIPYMVMEYVEGESILKYCDRNKLTIEQRLDLFKTICRTIQFAHKSLIVHRDLKPDNILVTASGHVKILDFGIAKLLDPNLYEITGVQTQTGMRILSLEYASPEQISGKPVTTSSDIYSLGILIYKLLTGLHPYETKNLAYREVEKMVLELDPPPASGRFQSAGEDLKQEISENRGLKKDELNRSLEGDLDAIINKTLRKESERRYDSVESLIIDIERHQTGLPIYARPDTLGYRAKKFIQRHRTGVTVAAFMTLLIAAIVGLYTIRVTTERNRAEQSARQAMLEAEKAEAVKNFLIDVFEVSDPNLSLGETITAQELLDQGAERIDDELANQPEIQAEMLGVMGEVYQQLGLFDKAGELLEESLNKYRTLPDIDPVVLAGALNRMALLQYNQGDFEASIGLLENALDLRQSHPETDPDELSEAQNNLATLYMENGQYEAADSLLRMAIETRRALEHPAGLAESLNTLALLQYEKGNLDEAETLYEEVLALERSYLKPDHPSLAETTHNLAQLYWTRGKLDVAERLFREVIEIDKRVFGEDHTTVALDLNSLALVLMDKGDFDEAEAAYKEAIRIQQEKLGEEHPDLTATYYNLGSMYSFTGQYKLAEPMLRRVLEIDRKLFDDSHPNVGIDMTSLGGVLIALGQYEEAGSLLDEALSIFSETFPEDHPRMASVQIRRGELAYHLGNYEEAEKLLKVALPIADKTFNTPWKTANARTSLGKTLLAQGRINEAETYLLEAETALSGIFDDDHVVLQATQNALREIRDGTR